MKKQKEVEKVKRGRGRPKTNRPTKTNLLVIRLEDMEIEELKILQRDTKADSMTALIRNFISIGANALANHGFCLKQNEIFYKRFYKVWDGTKHHKEYSDEWGLLLKGHSLEDIKKNKNVNK
jgi:hypothetical protein